MNSFVFTYFFRDNKTHFIVDDLNFILNIHLLDTSLERCRSQFVHLEGSIQYLDKNVKCIQFSFILFGLIFPVLPY